MKQRTLLFSVFIGLIVMLIISSCRKHQNEAFVEDQDWLAGGGQTTFIQGNGAFGQPFQGMTPAQNWLHEIGDKGFEAIFVSAPAPKNSGLGPIFNAVSCAACHISDGRGKAPEAGEPLQSLLIRVSKAGKDATGGPMEMPLFGGQFQQKAVAGNIPEGDVSIIYAYQTGLFFDGDSFELRTPTISLINLYQNASDPFLMSPRIAPPVFGLGLLEAIPEWMLLANADPTDANNDGISGRANYVWDVLLHKTVLGRFGWKANTPNLMQQIAAAFNQDMGITNTLFPTESSWGQTQYDQLNDDVELADSILHAVAFYMRSLAVPARRNVKDPEVIRGQQLFNAIDCAKCHTPKQKTKVDVVFPAISNQKIFPYTDLLLHDMGAGLADNRPDFLATGSEWRTPPLWGIGLTEVVNGHSNFLHDGRARSLLEAILWHGGEGETSKNKFKQLSKSDRQAVIKFLKSL